MRNSKSRFSALPGIVSGPLMVPPAHFVCQVDFERALAAISEGGALDNINTNGKRDVVACLETSHSSLSNQSCRMQVSTYCLFANRCLGKVTGNCGFEMNLLVQEAVQCYRCHYLNARYD